MVYGYPPRLFTYQLFKHRSHRLQGSLVSVAIKLPTTAGYGVAKVQDKLLCWHVLLKVAAGLSSTTQREKERKRESDTPLYDVHVHTAITTRVRACSRS